MDENTVFQALFNHSF